jgi:hypothetical protein
LDRGVCRAAEGGGEVLGGVVLAQGFEEAWWGYPQPFGEDGADGMHQFGVVVAATGEAVTGETSAGGRWKGDG